MHQVTNPCFVADTKLGVDEIIAKVLIFMYIARRISNLLIREVEEKYSDMNQASVTTNTPADRAGFKHEFLLDNASPKSIWNQISTATGLSEWFAPRVDIVGDEIHVFWDEEGDDRRATITESDFKHLIKWVWDDDPESFMIFEIVVTELSGVTSLIVEDHDISMETSTLARLWDNHIDQLKNSLGLS